MTVESIVMQSCGVLENTIEPGKEREVFGKLRYMNSGLERKFEMELYLKKIDSYKYLINVYL